MVKSGLHESTLPEYGEVRVSPYRLGNIIMYSLWMLLMVGSCTFNDCCYNLCKYNVGRSGTRCSQANGMLPYMMLYECDATDCSISIATTTYKDGHWYCVSDHACRCICGRQQSRISVQWIPNDGWEICPSRLLGSPACMAKLHWKFISCAIQSSMVGMQCMCLRVYWCS